MWGFALLVTVVALWLLYRKRNFSFLKELGIPGPEPNLLFGNMLELAKKSPLDCFDEWIQKYGKVVGYYLGTRPVILINDVELLKKIQISEFHKFINRPNLRGEPPDDNTDKKKLPFSQNLITLRGKRWKEIRSIISPSFTASKMKQMAPIMNTAIDYFLGNVEKKCEYGEEFDIYPMFQRLTLDLIGRTAFGIETDSQKHANDSLIRCSEIILAADISSPIMVLARSFRFINVLWTFLLYIRISFMNKGKNPFKEISHFAKSVIATRRNNKEASRPDLLQSMIDAKIDDLSKVTSDNLTAKEDDDIENESKGLSSSKLIRRMTDTDILDNSVLFLMAGYETTSTTLAFIVHQLVHYPEVQEKLRQEIKELSETEGELNYHSLNKLQYLDQVLHETLRMYTPITPFVGRECREDADLGKIKLKKGMAIQILAWTLHRDPELWGPDVNEFKPERFSPENKSKIHPMAFQAFGQGPRNCIGMRFALMATKLALARLLSKYKFKKCSKTDKREPQIRITMNTNTPQNGVWVKAAPV